jgi:hypothetical protein
MTNDLPDDDDPAWDRLQDDVIAYGRALEQDQRRAVRIVDQILTDVWVDQADEET